MKTTLFCIPCALVALLVPSKLRSLQAAALRAGRVHVRRRIAGHGRRGTTVCGAGRLDSDAGMLTVMKSYENPMQLSTENNGIIGTMGIILEFLVMIQFTVTWNEKNTRGILGIGSFPMYLHTMNWILIFNYSPWIIGKPKISDLYSELDHY